MTLTEFLLARIAEDEADASRPLDDEEVIWARRTLKDCEAKWQIVEWHREAVDLCDECSGRNNHEWPCRTLKALAAVYADHPDYRDEWKS